MAADILIKNTKIVIGYHQPSTHTTYTIFLFCRVGGSMGRATSPNRSCRVTNFIRRGALLYYIATGASES